MVRIYTLSHPITNEIRYIGMTKSTLKVRLSNHIIDTKRENTRKANWIKSLLKINLKPFIEELDFCENWKDGCKLEIYWISQFKTWGFDLTNHSEGGDGIIGYVKTQEQREAHSKRMKIHFSDPKNNKFLGKHHSEESKKLISLANKGKKKSEKFKQRRREIQKDWKPSEYVTERMIEVHGRRVVQLNRNLNFIKEYYTIREAAKLTTSLDEKITDCCKKKRYSHNGFVWMYKEDFNNLTEEYKKFLIVKLHRFRNYK